MANNVKISLERNLWKNEGIACTRYIITVNDEHYVTGYINNYAFDTNTKYADYGSKHYMNNKEMITTIQKMYYWLF